MGCTVKECHVMIITMRAILQELELLCHGIVNVIDTQWPKKLTLGCHSDLDLHQSQCNNQGKSHSPVWGVAIRFTSLVHWSKLLMKRHLMGKVNKKLMRRQNWYAGDKIIRSQSHAYSFSYSTVLSGAEERGVDGPCLDRSYFSITTPANLVLIFRSIFESHS